MNPLDIPRTELATWRLTVHEANDLAGAGEHIVGRMRLLGGLARARELAEKGEPWGQALAERYEAAFAEFKIDWGWPVD